MCVTFAFCKSTSMFWTCVIGETCKTVNTRNRSCDLLRAIPRFFMLFFQKLVLTTTMMIMMVIMIMIMMACELLKTMTGRVVVGELCGEATVVSDALRLKCWEIKLNFAVKMFVSPVTNCEQVKQWYHQEAKQASRLKQIRHVSKKQTHDSSSSNVRVVQPSPISNLLVMEQKTWGWSLILGSRSSKSDKTQITSY